MEMPKLTIPKTLSEWNGFGKDYLPGYLGIEILSVNPEEVHARMNVQKQLTAPNGFLHAAAVVALADTACGYATAENLPDEATGFTTIELKTNFLGTALEGNVSCVARPHHRGRSTQVWDAEVKVDETGKTIALFRCTQMIFYKKENRAL